MATEESFRTKTASLGLAGPLPFQFNKNESPLPNQKVILIHTNFIASVTKTFTIVRDIANVKSQLEELMAKKSGLLAYSLLAKPLSGNYETITVWTDTKSVASFYYRGNHKEVMARWKAELTAVPFEKSVTKRYSIDWEFMSPNVSKLRQIWNTVKAGEGLEVWQRENKE